MINGGGIRGLVMDLRISEGGSGVGYVIASEG